MKPRLSSMVTRITAAVAGVMAATVPLTAAELQPPLQALRHPNFTVIVGQRLDAPVSEGRMLVRVLERLRGDPDVPDTIELLVQAGDETQVEAGQDYLMFYSDVERVNFKPRQEVRRPDRRKLLHIAGADPAVFADTPQMRGLFAAEHAAVESSPDYRQIVLDGLDSGDPAMVDLWSAEWALRPGTFPQVDAAQSALLSRIVENPGQRPAARARILQVGAQRTLPASGRWFADSAAVVLEETQLCQLSEKAGLAQLIYASLEIAQKNPDASKAPHLEKWLRAAPPLAENAALALRAIEPQLEREAVSSAIADNNTPEQTRSFLIEHLRRVELAHEH